MLLSSLPKSYEGIVDILVYGRETLDMGEVRAALNTKEIQKKAGSKDNKAEVLWVKERGRSRGKSRGKYGKGRSIQKNSCP